MHLSDLVFLAKHSQHEMVGSGVGGGEIFLIYLKNCILKEKGIQN